MQYFVTGGTGFIGRFLIPELLKRGGIVYLLVREASFAKLDELRHRWQADEEQLIGVAGDITEAHLGMSGADRAMLKGQIDHFFHLAALYDMEAPESIQQKVNVFGTREAMSVATQLRARCFHHVSSIAVAGLYRGTFREDMLDEATGLNNPYLKTKHDAERSVRSECEIPWRIYRPGIVVGHSVTGEIDKIDGPYYSFKLIQKIRNVLPPWFPTVGLEGGRLNLVPVDYVVKAMDVIAHQPGEDGKCFHLTDPDPYRLGEILNLFCEAGHAPRMGLRVDARLLDFIPPLVRQTLAKTPPLQRFRRLLLEELGIPEHILAFLRYPTRFDNREAERVLQGTGIEVPRLPTYAATLWDYWERHLDPDLFRDQTLSGAVTNKRCLVTGGTSGIGLATATKLVEAGATTLIVARTQGDVDRVVSDLRLLDKGPVQGYVADLSDEASTQALIAALIQDHGGVDILINNAGRSIRRSIVHSLERPHDFERTMQLNYFGSLRLIIGFLPGMLERQFGQIINISTMGVQTYAPRFAAYVASKAALDAFSRCAGAEFADDHIVFTTVNMPLVRTPMITPTQLYNHLPALSPDAAADLIMDAILKKPRRVATRLGVTAQVLQAISPRLSEMIMATGFRMFSDSSAASGASNPAESPDNMMLSAFLRGLHW